jgi:hypothetical protein
VSDFDRGWNAYLDGVHILDLPASQRAGFRGAVTEHEKTGNRPDRAVAS